MTAPRSAPSTPRDNPESGRFAACGQLSLVEHALCPLDARTSLQQGLVHHTTFQYSDRDRRRQTARVEVSAPRGLSAHDEYYLWGLLALTLSQNPTETELHATPHFCLRQFELVDTQSRRGGRQYQQFATAVERLSWVRYGCNAFYDPIRAEHCQVRFGFFSYRLPQDPASNRAWRIYWDNQFLEYVRGAGGNLRFDLARYRRLSPAARRLFLFVSKVFPRMPHTPRLGLRQLAVEMVGLSPRLPTKHLLAKTRRICAELAEEEVIVRPDANDFRRRDSGEYDVTLTRHPKFEQPTTNTMPGDSPLVEPLKLIGLDSASITRVLQRFPTACVREWVDITLAAKERFGHRFFKQSPAAYFMDNVQNALSAGRTPPDWWLDIRKAEELRQASHDRSWSRSSKSVPVNSHRAFDTIRQDIFGELQSAGLPSSVAVREATRRAQQKWTPHSSYERQHPTPAGTILATLPVKLR